MTAEQLDALAKLGEELTAVEECLESMRLEQAEDRAEAARQIDNLLDIATVQNAHLAAICAKLGVRSDLKHVPRRTNSAPDLPSADQATEADPDTAPWT